MVPGTEFARDVCAEIRPLQLGVVLVRFCFVLNKLKIDRGAISLKYIVHFIQKEARNIAMGFYTKKIWDGKLSRGSAIK